MAMWHLMFGMGIGLVLTVGLTLMTMVSQQKALPNRPKEERSYHSTPNESCPICLFNMTNNDMAYLQCRHAVHEECLKKLKEYSNKCPICREKF